MIAALVGVGNHGGADAAAARVLRKAATVARAQPAEKPLQRGHFRYTKSLVAYMSGGKGWNALSPGVREIWLAANGAGRLHERWGKPTFPSAADRAGWIAAGRPQVNPREDSGNLPPSPRVKLPTDPDALYAKLHDRAVGSGNGTGPEMFTLVGDALRESDASPALRASLYEVECFPRAVSTSGSWRQRNPWGWVTTSTCLPSASTRPSGWYTSSMRLPSASWM